uniref:CUB domain-containing protein n=1 Tax=Anopheles atroparvus TaxID=41427 RepID=A0AAG5D1L3_ANOAO
MASEVSFIERTCPFQHANTQPAHRDFRCQSTAANLSRPFKLDRTASGEFHERRKRKKSVRAVSSPPSSPSPPSETAAAGAAGAASAQLSSSPSPSPLPPPPVAITSSRVLPRSARSWCATQTPRKLLRGRATSQASRAPLAPGRGPRRLRPLRHCHRLLPFFATRLPKPSFSSHFFTAAVVAPAAPTVAKARPALRTSSLPHVNRRRPPGATTVEWQSADDGRHRRRRRRRRLRLRLRQRRGRGRCRCVAEEDVSLPARPGHTTSPGPSVALGALTDPACPRAPVATTKCKQFNHECFHEPENTEDLRTFDKSNNFDNEYHNLKTSASGRGADRPLLVRILLASLLSLSPPSLWPLVLSPGALRPGSSPYPLEPAPVGAERWTAGGAASSPDPPTYRLRPCSGRRRGARSQGRPRRTVPEADGSRAVACGTTVSSNSANTSHGSDHGHGSNPGVINHRQHYNEQRRQHRPSGGVLCRRQYYGVRKALRMVLPALLIVNMFTFLHGECDQTFVSRAGGPSNGTFSAPMLTNPSNHSRQCLYIFLAGPGQRVDVSFTSFILRGTPPDGAAVGELPACVHEYMDVYAEVQSSDPAELINSPFGGRYCGPIPPRRRISLYRAIALSFYTDKNSTSPDVFEGRYAFINESEYEIGQPVIGSPCSYVINFAQKRTGAIISPTYPGAYPKDMSCTYQFIGKPSQRVRIEFRDFDLFFGGPHCPFDYVRVFDGPDNTSAVIGTYCGQQRNLVLYSSEHYLFIHFSTLQRTANTQNRGFKGIFEFSESFVKLDFIRENDGMHIRGSECDQKILSKKESTGFVYSPNYPYPFIPKVVCRYFVYGMQDAQNLERVKLEFSIFEIPKGEHKDKSESNCTDGYLKVYLKGQEVADAYDKFDHELCGGELPHAVISDGPRLVMVFSSGELQGRGFKAKYTFETEYKIPGTAAPDGTCSFTYRSTSRKKGEFNSPRYPSNYPSETNCSYVFLATPNEQVTIVFDHFKVKADGANTTGGAYGASVCFEDWLEMYVLYRDGTERFLGRYCSLTAPGPVESPRGAVGIRVVLHTDLENVASGFKARYIFETAKSVFGDCGGNFSGEDSGIVTSPNFPANYDGPGKGLASRACNWYITARIGYKILLNFDYFAIEGEPATRGCAAAVMRLWLSPDSDMPPIEMCGEKPALEHWQYVTQGQTARISFTSADKAIGAQGFRIIWTEVQDTPAGPSSTISLLCESTYHFQCLTSGYCISERLRCDGVKNCGPLDNSDEMHCESHHHNPRGGSRRLNNILHSRRLVPNLSPLHSLSSKKKTQTSQTAGSA